MYDIGCFRQIGSLHRRKSRQATALTALFIFFSSHSHTVHYGTPAYCLFNHITAAFRTRLIGRLLPGHEFTFRDYPHIRNTFFPFFFCAELLPYRRPDIYADLFQIRLSYCGIPEILTCQKSSVRTVLDHHVASALLADDIRHLVLYFIFLQLLFRLATACARSG